MTNTTATTVRARIALRVVALGIVTLAVWVLALLPEDYRTEPAAAASVATEAPAEITYHRIDAIPEVQGEVLTLAPDQDLTEAQATEVLLAADRVCEGMQAGVPLMDMAIEVQASQGLTGVEAHDFVKRAAQAHC
jgi:hypothetical protein